ncbi:metal ABC transporter permease [Bacillus suaedae]|uniref:Manganese transport system membrane protein MntC n=1 Tax=Halalkalibacter suaedae TaxID=2822140 RepID=A0A941AQX3_9BACI|nr:metal ABC transporter permease [Bacillus suaedae]MBP3953337.1 metal ABC transporter permease [Bacillus suaedae]
MIEIVINLFTNPNSQWVLIGTTLLGIASGVLGSFALLRKQSLIGDAMAHAALPGICVAYLIIGSKSMIWFLIGAALAGLLATYFIQMIIKHSRIKEDTAIGLILSVFFGFGIVLLTYINQNSNGNQSGLDEFIFGQAASLVGTDVRIISGVAITLIIITFILFKELKLLTFDAQFARGIGLPTGLLNGLLMTLIVGAVVIGLQTVGVILMAAMLITPAIAARYWTERLDHMIIISGVIGAVSGVLGTALSISANKMPTGPLIIVAATIIFLVSLVFAPNRGLLMKSLRQYKLRKEVLKENTLQTLYDLLEETLQQKPTITSNDFSTGQIIQRRHTKKRALEQTLVRLEKDGLTCQTKTNQWTLTNRGLKVAHTITLQNRLVEVYLMNETKFAHLNIKQDQKSDIFKLPKEILEELKELLLIYDREPKAIQLVTHSTSGFRREANSQ